MKKVLPEPSLPCLQNPSEATPVASVQRRPPPSAVSANSILQGIHQDVDSATSPVEGRTADAVCMSKEATKDKVKQQTPSKRWKKRVKTSSPKLVDEKDSNQHELELKRPVSDDICNRLQLGEPECREFDKRQQNVSKLCDQSHDLQTIAGINGSQDTEQSMHCQTSLTNNTEECRSSPQRRVAIHNVMQTHSSIVQQQRLSDSEIVTNVQSTSCKH